MNDLHEDIKRTRQMIGDLEREEKELRYKLHTLNPKRADSYDKHRQKLRDRLLAIEELLPLRKIRLEMLLDKTQLDLFSS